MPRLARSLTNAPQRGWGYGWPINRSSDMRAAEGGGVRVWVHFAIAPIVSYLLAETVRRGYPLRQVSCGGFASRPMKYTNGTFSHTPSNHSWGLAIDLNWDRNGFGKSASHDIPQWVGELWSAWGFSWGGWWGTPDWMHFEFALTPADAARFRAQLAQGQYTSSGTPATQQQEDKEVTTVAAPYPGTPKGRQAVAVHTKGDKQVVLFNGAVVKGDKDVTKAYGCRVWKIPCGPSEVPISITSRTDGLGFFVTCSNGATFDGYWVWPKNLQRHH